MASFGWQAGIWIKDHPATLEQTRALFKEMVGPEITQEEVDQIEMVDEGVFLIPVLKDWEKTLEAGENLECELGDARIVFEH